MRRTVALAAGFAAIAGAVPAAFSQDTPHWSCKFKELPEMVFWAKNLDTPWELTVGGRPVAMQFNDAVQWTAEWEGKTLTFWENGRDTLRVNNGAILEGDCTWPKTRIAE